MKRVLVAGRSGQVARALLHALPAAGFEVKAMGRPALDIADPASVAAAVAAAAPDAVINAAAWTAVDAAETQEAEAFTLNALGPAHLAAACARAGVPLLHLSTDYVFGDAAAAGSVSGGGAAAGSVSGGTAAAGSVSGGVAAAGSVSGGVAAAGSVSGGVAAAGSVSGGSAAAGPRSEAEPPAPAGAYGRTKLAGEWAALAGHERVAVFRCAWVYDAEGRNFLRTMLRLGAEREEVAVVADQLGHPTAAPALARMLAGALARIRDGGWRAEHRGVFHAVSPDWTSWHGFAAAIFEEAARLGRPAPRLRAIATADYPTPAARPADGRLDAGKLRAVFGVALPPWREPLPAIVAAALGVGANGAR